jgi:hypothetical protein
MTLICALGIVSCAEKKEKTDAMQNEETFSPLVQSEASTRLEIDATSRSEWVGLDLDQTNFINAADFPANKGWDLAFKRTTIKMEGAVVMQTVDQDYAAITVAPQDGYASDQPSTEPGAPETTGLAFHKEPSWFAYDVTTHAVSSRGLVYVIRSNEGRTFKLRIIDYYNAARLPAYFTLEFQELKGAAS